MTTRGKGQKRRVSTVAAAPGCLFPLVLYRIRGRCPLNLSNAFHRASAHGSKGVFKVFASAVSLCFCGRNYCRKTLIVYLEILPTPLRFSLRLPIDVHSEIQLLPARAPRRGLVPVSPVPYQRALSAQSIKRLAQSVCSRL